MKIKYMRKLMTSYMIIEQADELQQWEQQMAACNQMEGVLFAEYIKEDGEGSNWYDITGKQDLELLLENRALDQVLFTGLIKELCNAAEKISEYLLCPENLILQSECIFYDDKIKKFFFCYCPGKKENFKEEFGNLMEYLLPKIKHEDHRAVELAYGIYQYTQEAVLSFDGIQKLIYQEYEKDKADEKNKAGERDRQDIRDEPDELDVKDKSVINGECFDRGRRSADMYSSDTEYDTRQVKQGGCENFIKQVIHRLLEPIRGRFESVIPSMPGAFHKEDVPFVFEPDEEDCSIPQSNPTILLSGINRRPEGILRYEGKGICSDLIIDGRSYTIGSSEDCDGLVPSGAVSRKHARITQKDGIYFIEDLNSSNGTYVGGEILSYKTKCSLEKNEVILFADEKFRFI